MFEKVEVLGALGVFEDGGYLGAWLRDGVWSNLYSLDIKDAKRSIALSQKLKMRVFGFELMMQLSVLGEQDSLGVERCLGLMQKLKKYLLGLSLLVLVVLLVERLNFVLDGLDKLMCAKCSDNEER